MAKKKREGYPSNKRQSDFMVFVVVEGMGKPEAALKAGYSESFAQKRAGHLYNTMQAYALELHEHNREVVAERHGLSIDRITDELAAIGFVNPKDYIVLRNIDGQLFLFGKPLNELTDEQARAIESWEVKSHKIGNKYYADYRYKFYDKRGALRDMGQHLGMYTERMILEARVTQVESVDLSGVPDNELEFWMNRMQAYERGEKLPPIEGEFKDISDQLGLPQS